MKYTHFLLLVVFGIGMLSGCKEDTRKSIETPEPQFSEEGELAFLNEKGDTLGVFTIEIAKTPYEQQTGLMYRKRLEKNQGMLFIYPNERPRNGFYMKNTYIPLDLIYINAKNEIVDFNENTEPMDEKPLPSKVPAKYVLEVNAGSVEDLGLKLGNLVVFERF